MTSTTTQIPYRVLFLCTGNSGRSQMAEAIMNSRSRNRVVAESAGTHPAPQVNPFAIAALQRSHIDWSGHVPRGIDGIQAEEWDFVITLCDRAKEACPVLPGRPIHVHWGMADPAEIQGTDEQKLQAFIEGGVLIARRIDLMLALRVEEFERLAIEQRLGAIATDTAPPLRIIP